MKKNYPECRVPRVRTRRGRCYELALKGMMRSPRWLLVHGYFDCRGAIVGHAWLLCEGKIFCPTMDRLFHEPTYYAKHQTVPIVTYTVREAAKMAIRYKHYGPWIEAEKLL